MKSLKLMIIPALLAVSLAAEAYNPVEGVKAQKQEALKYAKKFVTVEQMLQWQKEGKAFTIVDVREKGEILAGHIPYKPTLTIPRGVIYSAVKKGKLKPDETYVLVCRTGHRAILASAVLAKYFHFKNAYVLKGGIKSWIQSGGLIKNALHLGKVKITLTK